MIIVFGSIIADYIYSVSELPKPGETVLADALTIMAGGKGANQALAAAKAGAEVKMIGAVGRDPNGEIALKGLQDHGVNLDAVTIVDETTGMASVCVDGQGENAIIVAPGANRAVKQEQVEDDYLQSGHILLLQMEVPISEQEALIDRARKGGARVILNLAPAHPITLEALKSVDILIANEGELAVLMELCEGERDLGLEQSLLHVSVTLGASVIATLGSKGAMALHEGEIFAVSALPVDAVDTVGAGDAFAGAFAAALDRGLSFEMSLKQGVVAGSLTCQQTGAQEALPDLEVIERHLQE